MKTSSVTPAAFPPAIESRKEALPRTIGSGTSAKSTLNPIAESRSPVFEFFKKIASLLWKCLSCALCKNDKKTKELAAPIKPTTKDLLFTPNTKEQQAALDSYNQAVNVYTLKLERHLEELPKITALKKQLLKDQESYNRDAAVIWDLTDRWDGINATKNRKNGILNEAETLEWYKTLRDIRKELPEIKKRTIALKTAIKEHESKIRAFESENATIEPTRLKVEKALAALQTAYTVTQEQLTALLPKKTHTSSSGEKTSSFRPILN